MKAAHCACGQPLEQAQGRGRSKLNCDTCKAERARQYERHNKDRRRAYDAVRKNLTCCLCGSNMPWGKSSLPQGEAMCRPCRSIARRKACAECGETFSTYRGKYCSRSCANRAAAVARGTTRSPDDHHVTRAMREYSAPGLSTTARKRLLDRWRRQGRACIYCDCPATTVDHVIPLVRGGTNFEGNLAPCCKRCNSSKSGWMVVEWRSGLRAPGMNVTLAVREKRAKKARVARRPFKPYGAPCELCGEAFLKPRESSKFCSESCRKEANARVTRDAYRLAAGLPVDPSRPTKRWSWASRKPPLAEIA